VLGRELLDGGDQGRRLSEDESRIGTICHDADDKQIVTPPACLEAGL
jgi:hypothetical protein